ncbi:MAG: DALR anticodon-binding domain-containing protein, partial [Terriglobia bacterium]
PTYFASDVAYHRHKLGRGFSKLINVWGADHHGYVKRVEAGLEALGYPKGTLEVVLGQLVNLYRGGTPVRMSKRTGDMVTLEELVEEVGADSVRFFFLMRSTDSPLDFDIDLAKKRSDENPVFYVQYAHARISSIIRFAEDQGKGLKDSATVDLTLLKADSERALVRRLAAFEDLIETAASKRAPHLLTQYARELATAFHLFYHECRVVGNADQADASGASLDAARLYLVTCVRSVIANACNLLGISAPEKM